VYEASVISVVATLRTAPGQREALLRELQKIVPKVRAEQGCVEYVPTVDVESGISAQGAVRSDVVTVIEKWEDLEALRQHLTAPHLVQFLGAAKGMLAGLEIQVLAPA
jgi:quinol monooxygenase YgiN